MSLMRNIPYFRSFTEIFLPFSSPAGRILPEMLRLRKFEKNCRLVGSVLFLRQWGLFPPPLAVLPGILQIPTNQRGQFGFHWSVAIFPWLQFCKGHREVNLHSLAILPTGGKVCMWGRERWFAFEHKRQQLWKQLSQAVSRTCPQAVVYPSERSVSTWSYALDRPVASNLMDYGFSV